MRSKGIDCLVMQNNNQYLGGYVRWFTDVFAENSYPITVIFPLDEEMTMITSGGPPIPPFPPKWATAGVKEIIGSPYFLSLNYTKFLDAEITKKVLKDLNAKNVGFLGENFIPASFYNYLKENLPDVHFFEAADDVDEIKAVKSEEEIQLIQKACALQDAAMLAIRLCSDQG